MKAAAAIATAVRGGQISALAIIEEQLAAIAQKEPALNCFTEVLADRARREARAIDALVAAGRDPGPLAGVPFGLKDNFDIAGRVTTAGSLINRDDPPAAADGVLLRRLTAAGAILLGAQNMDEYAYGFTTENAHYGTSRNPHDQTRTAGGSSGGSAAAVAAGLCGFALGTDTNGSVRVPASFCGLFGLKPTYGRLPRTGTFPFVHELDHAGILAARLDDLALVYDVLQGHDAGDGACADRPAEPVRSGLAGLPDGTRVAVLDGWFETMADAQGTAAVAAVAQALGTARRVSLPGAAQARAAAFVMTAASAANLHLESLRRRAGDFDPATRDRLLAGALLPAGMVQQAQRFRSLFREQVREIFRDHDLLLAPATPCAAPLIDQPTITIDGRPVATRPNIGVLTQPLSFVGLPVVVVPVRGAGLPIGVQIVAPPWREDLAFQAATRIERAGLCHFKGLLC